MGGSHAGSRPHSRWRTPLVAMAVLTAAAAIGVWAVGGSGSGNGAADEPLTTTDDPDSTTPTTPTTPPGPVAPSPRVGDCRTLQWSDTQVEVTEFGSRPTRCGRAHTGETVATGRLDTSTGLDPAADPERLVRSVSRQCRSAVVDWLGDGENSYELSMYAYVVAVPTTRDLAAGARWWRCDLYATAREARLTRLPATTRGLLRGNDADQWATCVQGPLGQDQTQVLCRKRHDWRAISAHRLGTGDESFPGGKEVLAEVRTTCRDDVTAYVADPLEGFDYGWLRPTRAAWNGGQRFALCFARTPD